MFNEKIFLFLWFWFFMVSAITICSLFHWIIISLFPGQRERFVKKYIRATDLVTDRQSVKKFVLKFLGYDGVFCLRMVSAHAGDIMATELVVALWHDFNNRARKSPIEMFEGGQSMANQGKLQENAIKNWLMGHQKKPPGYDSANRTKSKRRKSDGYFTFV